MASTTPSVPSGDEGAKRGELVEIDYELWSESPSGERELVDTTREEVAKMAGVPAPEGYTFGPRPHRRGGNAFPAGIESAIQAAAPGTEFSREFTPAEAFGERDPKLIELFSMHEISRLPEMRRPDADLHQGTILTIGGRQGRVVTITAARVRVDFNRPLAGRKIHGSFRILKEVTDPVEQVRAIIGIEYGHGPEFRIEMKGTTLSITVPERSKFDFQWMAAKPRLIEEIRSQLKPSTLHLIEEYVTPASKAVGGSKVTGPSAAERTSPETSGAQSKEHGHAESNP
ncbi:MAG: FKBP-type peptidyl-prolyl cis-trans isomerase, partial [Thermoplasmata archaeon]